MPRISSAKTDPMCANWTRCSGRASAFAPASMRTLGPRFVGMTIAMPGRWTPGSRRMCRSDAASIAPVFPAETTTSASPSATARTARTSDESVFARTASTAWSSIEIDSDASTSGRPWDSRPGGPNSVGRISDEAAAAAPATISSGERSPPRASTATRITGRTLRRVDAERLDVPALVRLAVRADAMRSLRLLAGRADLEARNGDPVLRAALVAPRPRRLSLRNGHERLLTIAAARATSSAPLARGNAGRARRRRALRRNRRARSRAAPPPRDRGGSSARRGRAR